MKVKSNLFFIMLLFLLSLLSAESDENTISAENAEKNEYAEKSEYKVESQALDQISSLSFEAYDSVLIELDEAVERNDMLFMAHKKTNPKFYTYIPSGKDGVLSVSAATQVPVDTFVTLNSISSSESVITGKKVLLTDVKGIFVAEEPETELEIFLYNTYKNELEKSQVFHIDGKKFYFFEGERFSPYHRLYFLDSNFSLPLDKKVVTSPYGLRESPVYGTGKKHNGIDFAAKEGSGVFVVCAKIEEEISELDDDEKAEYLDAMGLNGSDFVPPYSLFMAAAIVAAISVIPISLIRKNSK